MYILAMSWDNKKEMNRYVHVTCIGIKSVYILTMSWDTTEEMKRYVTCRGI